VLELDGIDVRRWGPGTHTMTARLRVPADLPHGSYELSLVLPDAAAALATRPEYAIRLANAAVWNEAIVANRLGTIEIDATAAGDADLAATAFVELP
jgi:hypothetical protein